MNETGGDCNIRGIKLESCTDLANQKLHDLVGTSSSAALHSLALDLGFVSENGSRNVDPFTIIYSG